MRKMVDRSLTAWQQQLVSDNHSLIYSYAKTMNLELEEYYGILAIGLCEAAIVFDPELGFSFSTLAFSSMRNECYSYWRANYMRQKNLPKDLIFSLDAPMHDEPYSKEFYDKVRDIFSDKYRADIMKVELKEFIQSLSDKDQTILFYMFQGYEQKEIAAILGMTRSNVNDRLHKLKARWTQNRYKRK